MMPPPDSRDQPQAGCSHAWLSAVVSVIGPVVTGVAIVTAVEHSARRGRAPNWVGFATIGDGDHPLPVLARLVGWLAVAL
jgi:hypothetical protein